MEIVWNANAGGASNRKRAAKACEKCHHNKKRCWHREDPSTETLAPPPRATPVRATPQYDQIGSRSPKIVDREGDLVPKSILTDLSPPTWNATPGQNGVAGAAGNRLPIRQLSLHDPRSMLERFRYSASPSQGLSHIHSQYLQSVGADAILPRSTTDALIPVYASQIDACLPLLDGRKLLHSYFAGNASYLLIKAVCLKVCHMDEAVPFLRLEEDGPIVNPQTFADRVYQSLDAALSANLEQDRVAKVQILALMHTHHDGTRGTEEASKRLSQAIHDCHTLSLHYLEPGRHAEDEPSLLWWSLWTFDRINACIASRPMMLFNSNMSLPRPSSASSYRSQIMCAWLSLSDLLEQIYQIYVPPNEQEEYTGDFPPFEKACMGVNTCNFQHSHSALLQVYYHTIAMLSCRAGYPDSPSYVRRSTAADEVQRLAGKFGPKRLLPIPLVPYSISLALTAAYRDLRDGHKTLRQSIIDILARCELLEEISDTWPSAAVMARLGRTVLDRTGYIEDQGTTAPLPIGGEILQPASNREGNTLRDSSRDHAQGTERSAALSSPQQSLPVLDGNSKNCDTINTQSSYLEPAEHSAASAIGSLDETNHPPGDDSLEALLYGDLDGIYASMLDRSWLHMSQDFIDFGDPV